jgi:two-component system sensor histidine kinase UhpB
MSLLTRLLVTNAIVLTAAVAVLALTPATVSHPVDVHEVAVLVAGLAAVVVLNMFLLGRSFAPLRRLSAAMDQVDHLRPGPRIPVYGDDEEIVRLTDAFNRMLDRLDEERVGSWRRAVQAQERERHRVAQELHDEVGQSLTAMKLLLSRASKATSPEERDQLLAETGEITSATLAEVREIARRLRPEALDELGLQNALAALAKRSGSYGSLTVESRLGKGLPALTGETEVVLYRIAQEALTNVLRHAGASRASVGLDVEDGTLVLTVSDNGRGLNGTNAGSGIKGMRERALTIGAELTLSERPEGGAEVRLVLPLDPVRESVPA